MFKLSAFVLISIRVMLNMEEVAAVPEDGEIENNDVPKEEDETTRFLQQDQPWFSLGCVLFRDLGCDCECFVTADAFGRLGAGVCVDDNWCDCGYAINPTLDGIWKQKFPLSGAVILNEIKASKGELANKIHITLAQGFRTSQQSKDDLKPYLSNEQYNELEVYTTIPADQFIISLYGYNFAEIHRHVYGKLPIALKWRDADLAEARTHFEPHLFEALCRAKSKSSDKFEQLVHMVRRVRNKTLNDLIEEYFRGELNEVSVDDERVAAIDRISYIVVDELVKRVDKGTLQIAVGWVVTKVTSLLNKFRKTDNDRSPGEVLATPGPISYDWRKDGITIRYRRNHRDDVNLAWVKNSDRVCIFKSVEQDVNQSWMFDRKVIISLSRSRKGGFSQYWNFGTFSYHKYDGGPSEGEWSNGVPNEAILEEYQEKINEWCANNDSLIDKKFCVIYKNIDPDK